MLIFPEGRRTDDGEIGRFQPGVGMIGARLQVPVVPVRLDGLDRILHHTWKFPKRGTARVAFGRPMSLEGTDYADLARQVEEAVRRPIMAEFADEDVNVAQSLIERIAIEQG